MKAVSFLRPLPITDPESLVDIELDKPSPGARDLLVEVRAISVNPVDAKIRGGSGPRNPADAGYES
jgi:NADPH2:quinone reductase